MRFSPLSLLVVGQESALKKNCLSVQHLALLEIQNDIFRIFRISSATKFLWKLPWLLTSSPLSKAANLARPFPPAITWSMHIEHVYLNFLAFKAWFHFPFGHFWFAKFATHVVLIILSLVSFLILFWPTNCISAHEVFEIGRLVLSLKLIIWDLKSPLLWVHQSW